MKITAARQFRSRATDHNANPLHLVSTLALVLLLTLFATPPAHAQTFSVIHTFAGGGDGSRPNAGVTLQNGNLYGTTKEGGGFCIGGCGTAFELVRASNWMLTPIYFFLGSDGDSPVSRVVVGPDGHLYGTTYRGGSGGGVVYNLIPQPVLCRTLKCFWKETPVFQPWHQFRDLNGLNYGDVVWDSNGNIFGATQYGGPQNDGGVYEATCSDNGCTGGPIYIFSGLDGANPVGGVFVDKNDNVFVTTSFGGKYGHGTIVELTYQQGIGWGKTYQYDFQDGSDGRAPFAALISDSSGNLIGTAVGGGDSGGGTVFELSPVGNSWTFNVLYALPLSCSPSAPLTLSSTGNLYGTCNVANGFGSVFKLTKAGDTWTYTSLHEFNGADGSSPSSSVTIDADGTLYGIANEGGHCTFDYYGCGTVWMIKP